MNFLSLFSFVVIATALCDTKTCLRRAGYLLGWRMDTKCQVSLRSHSVITAVSQTVSRSGCQGCDSDVSTDIYLPAIEVDISNCNSLVRPSSQEQRQLDSFSSASLTATSEEIR